MKQWFDFSHFKGDLFGGITAGIVALPLALAFGVSSGLGPAFGLYGAIFIAFFAALFGGTNTQISGPTAPMTAVSMVMIAGIIASFEGNKEMALPTIFAVFFIAGIIQVIMGLIGIGSYIKFIPYPVVSGFMTAIGVLILFGELFNVLGYYPHKDKDFVDQFMPFAEEKLLDKILQNEAGEGLLVLENFEETIRRSEKEITEKEILIESQVLAKSATSSVIGKIKYFSQAVKNIKFYEVFLAFLTIFIVYGFKKITTKIPSTLVALVSVSLLAYFLKAYNSDPESVFNYIPIETIPSGFPAFFGFDIFGNLSLLSIKPFIGAAISLAFLGAIDSLLTSVVADNMTKTKHKSNQELIGQGIGNSIAALFKGIPGAGATIRTVVNINAGGKTRISGMVAGVLLLVISLAISDAASQIPKAVLAGILVTVGLGVMDYKGLRAIPTMQKDLTINIFGKKIMFRSEALILAVVLVISVIWDLIFAVGIGLVISALMFMKRMGSLTKQESKTESLSDADKVIWEDEKDFPIELKEEVYVKHLNGPLFFGYVNDFRDLAAELPDYTKNIIIRMDRVPYIDQSGLYALEEILLDFKIREKNVLLVCIQPNVALRLRAIDIIPNLVEEERVFEGMPETLNWLKANVKDTVQP